MGEQDKRPTDEQAFPDGGPAAEVNKETQEQLAAENTDWTEAPDETASEESAAGEAATPAEESAVGEAATPAEESAVGEAATAEESTAGETATPAEESAAGEEPAAEAEGPQATSGKTKQASLRGLIGGMVAVAAVAVGLLASGVLDNTAYMPVAYAKDNALYVGDIRHDPYLVYDGLSAGGQFGYAYLGWGVTPSEGNDAVCFQADMTEDGTYNLYIRQTGSKEETQQVGQNVSGYKMSDNGKALAYVTTDGTLWYFGKNGSVQVATGVDTDDTAYTITADGKYIGYRTTGTSAYTIVRYTTANGQSDTLVDATQSYLFYGDGFYYLSHNDDGSFQLYDYALSAAAPAVLSDHAVGVAVSKDQSELLYLEKDDPTPYADLVEDDCSTADAAITEPVESDYPDADAYQSAKAEYDLKVERDAVRASISNGETVDMLMSCYRYTVGGETVKIADGTLNAAFAGDGVVYLAAPETTAKVKLSEAATLNGVLTNYYAGLSQTCITYFVGQSGQAVATGNRDVTLDNLLLSADGEKLFYTGLNDTKDGYTNLLGTLGDGDTLLPDDAEKMSFAPSGHGFVYMKNYAGNRGTLCYQADGDPVELSSTAMMYFFVNGGEGLFFMDADETDSSINCLRYYDGQNVTLVDTNVFYAQSYDNGVVAYLKDFNTDTGTGDLYLWKNGKTRLLDTGVSHMFVYEQ